MISFSGVDKGATGFCKLILYPITLLKLLIVSRSFLVECMGSLMDNKSSAD